jgi:ribose-phosphate pyrophosphokinase
MKILNPVIKISLTLICFFCSIAKSDVKLPRPYITLKRLESQSLPSCDLAGCARLIRVVVKEFGNENIYVRIDEPVQGLDIDVMMPNRLISSEFMELLIKIRTLKQDYAKSIRIQFQDLGASPSVIDSTGVEILSALDILRFLSVAGAHFVDGSRLRNRNAAYSPQVGLNLNRAIIVDDGSHPQMAQKISELTGLESRPSSFQFHKGQTAIVVAAPTPPVNEHFIKTLAQIVQIKKRTPNVALIMTNLPYARSDKVDHYGVAVAGRLIADLIEAAGASSLQFVRAHAPQSQGFFSIPSVQTMGRTSINRYLKSLNVDQIISPDAGFQKDATLYANELGLEIAVVNKQRNPKTGQISIVDMSGSPVMGKVVAIIDDETSTGGTLASVAEFLKKQGAVRVVAVVTHLTGNAQAAVDSVHIDNIAFTDTYPNSLSSNRLNVISIAEELVFDMNKYLPRKAMTCGELFSIKNKKRKI